MNSHVLAEEIADSLSAILANLRLPALLSRGEQELTSIQFVTLLAVDSGPEEGTTMGQLADQLGISRPAATALIDRLVDQQLIDRSQDPNDRRMVRIGLSPGGVAARGRLIVALETAVARALEGLPATAQGDLLMAVRHVSGFSQRMRTAEATPTD